jgi:nitrous oxidase accessory protein NosD
MQTKRLTLVLRLALLVMLTLIVFAVVSPESEHALAATVIAKPQDAASSCPAPTVMRGSQCVLDGDVMLDATLDIDSFTHLNCQGHKILPSSTSGTGIVRSAPEVAIFLNGAYGSKIQNCIIGDATHPFDFGIVIANSKIPPEQANDPEASALRGNKVLNNEIRTRAAGVQVFYADNTQISGNTFESIGGCSYGISVQYDSDSNLITDNTLIGSSGTSGAPMRGFPGTDDQIFTCVPDGILVIGAATVFPLVNVRVGSALIQLRNVPNIGDIGQTALSSDGNVIESNTSTQVGSSEGKANDGISVSHDTTDTLVVNNMVSGGLQGIRTSAITSTITIPGTCTLDSGRYCLSDADCFISGVDTAPKGTCTGVTTNSNVRRTSRGTRIEHNELTGSFNDRAINMVGQSTVIGNTIAATAPIGLAISNEMLETGIVQRNVVDGPVTALRLASGVASFFGAMVSLNDFTGYMNAVRVGNGYPFPTFLSADGRGNYWGLSCEAGGFDPAEVSQDDGSPPQVVVADDHPYGEAVAGTPDELLPPTCR